MSKGQPQQSNHNYRAPGKLISIIIPCYEEQDNIPILLSALDETLENENCEFIFVDDGSKDETLNVLRSLRTQDPRVHYISLSRNFGHQTALKAGLENAKGACAISLDGDNQHPPSLIPKMLKAWREGIDIVTTKRIDKVDTGLFKRVTSKTFYWLLKRVFGVRISAGAADFRLLDEKPLKALLQFQDPTPFFRGLVSLLGFRQSGIEYEVRDRLHGRSKYSFRKMLSLARSGIVSTTVLPLRFATGFSVLFLSFFVFYSIYTIITYFSEDSVVPGWASVALLLSLLGFVQSFILAIIGEYIAQISMSARGRPSYILKETSRT